MKNIKLILIGIFSFTSICLTAKDLEVLINGKITNAENRTIYLQTFKEDRNLVLDSVTLDKKGKFIFKTIVQEKNFYSLKLSESKPNSSIKRIIAVSHIIINIGIYKQDSNPGAN